MSRWIIIPVREHTWANHAVNRSLLSRPQSSTSRWQPSIKSGCQLCIWQVHTSKWVIKTQLTLNVFSIDYQTTAVSSLQSCDQLTELRVSNQRLVWIKLIKRWIKVYAESLMLDVYLLYLGWCSKSVVPNDIWCAMTVYSLGLVSGCHFVCVGLDVLGLPCVALHMPGRHFLVRDSPTCFHLCSGCVHVTPQGHAPPLLLYPF